MFYLIFILVFALILSMILSWGLGWRHPARSDPAGVSFLFLFLILLFTMWAGSVWIRPWGPMIYNTPWLEILLIGLFVSLLILAVAAPIRRGRTPSEPEAETTEEAVAATAFGLFFWILILGLLIGMIISYLI